MFDIPRKCFGICACVVCLTAFAEVRQVPVTGIPFEMSISEWTPPAREFPITQYGARPDGTPITEALEKAINACSAAGGGRVTVPAGRWTVGAFRFKSNVALVLDADATLFFPDDPVIAMRAPLRPDGRPNLTHSELVGGNVCTNVAILGPGTFEAAVDYWHRNFLLNPKKGFPRPQFFRFKNGKNIRFEDFKVRGSPAWTLVFDVCEDVILRRIDSVCTGPNTDGLDLCSCNRALVEDCSLDQTDDTYTIKSGMNEAGRARGIPCQNIVIRRCTAVHGHTLLGVGSEVSGGVRNLYMGDCTVKEQVWRFLFVKTNSRRGGFVENVWMENICGRKAQAVFETEMFYDGNPNKELPNTGKLWCTKIDNINIRNVTCAEAAYGVRVKGDEHLPPSNMTAENIRIGRVRSKLVSVTNAVNVKISNVVEDPLVAEDPLALPTYPQTVTATFATVTDAAEAVATVAPFPGQKNAGDLPLADAALLDLSPAAAYRAILEKRIRQETELGKAVFTIATTTPPLPPGRTVLDDRGRRDLEKMFVECGLWAVGADPLADRARNAYAYACRYGGIRKDGAQGNTATFTVRRFDPAALGDCGPLYMSFSKAPASVIYQGQALVKNADGAWALPQESGRTDLRTIDLADIDGKFAKVPGVTLLCEPNFSAGALRMTLRNGTDAPLSNLFAAVHLPPGFLTRYQAFQIPSVMPGATLVRDVPFGAGDQRLALDEPLCAVSVDVSRAGGRDRLWATALGLAPQTCTLARDVARWVGPVDAALIDDARLQALSAETGPLAVLGDTPEVAWRPSGFPGAAWYALSGPTRRYTPAEKALVDAGKAVKIAVLQFEAPKNSEVKFRWNAGLWNSDATLFLNGKQIPGKGKMFDLPDARPGVNRLVIRAIPKKGDYDECLQGAVYTWSLGSPLPAVPFAE
jgi:hypothetical protein